MYYDPPPAYASTETNPDFSAFVEEHKVAVDPRYGYVCVLLYRPFYFPGQTVRGFALIDAFNDIPLRDVFIRVKGRELPGKHGNRITKKLIKKYPSLKSELANLFSELAENPTIGTPLGNDIYKIRLAIASKNKGKSGGARVMSFVKVTDTTVLLFSIYNKGDKDSISDNEIEELLKDYQ